MDNGLESLLEQLLSGRRTYFRGIRTLESKQPDLKEHLALGVLYVTSHFGYALGKMEETESIIARFSEDGDRKFLEFKLEDIDERRKVIDA